MILRKPVFCTFFSIILAAIPAMSLAQTYVVNEQTNTNSELSSVAQREQAFRKKFHLTASEKMTFKRVPSTDELRDMIAKDPSLTNKKYPKKTVEFSDFESLLANPDFRFTKIMSDAGVFFIENSQEEQEERAKKVDDPIKTKVGEVFPKFRLATSDGSTLDNSMLKGRLTLINFFFDKCAPCIEETPMLNEFAKKHPEIQVLGMTFDNKKQVANYKKEHSFTWRVAYEGDAFIGKVLGIRSFPSYVLIDGHGKVLAIGGQSELKIDINNLVKNLEDLIERTTKS